MIWINELRARPLSYYSKNIVVALCAVVMLFSVFILSPMLSTSPSAPQEQGIQLPNGFTLPEGFDPSNLPEGFTPPAGFDPSNLPEGFAGQGGNVNPARAVSVSNTLQNLIPIAAIVALTMAIVSAFRPRWNTWATGIVFVAGLVSLAAPVMLLVQDAIVPFDLMQTVNASFWVTTIASLGLVLQLPIPRLHSDELEVDSTSEAVQAPTASRGGLSVTQNVAVALDALFANKLRSMLTMLGIIIGVGSVVSLIAVGRGAQTSITEQIEGTGLNQISIAPGGDTGATAGPPRPAGSGNGNSQTLTFGDFEALDEELSNILAVLPQYSSTLRVRSDQDNVQASVVGTTSDHASARDIGLDIGRYFDASEFDNNARVAVLGIDAAQDLFAGLNPLGRFIRIDGIRFEVIGVLEEQDGLGTNPNTQIYVPLSTGYRNIFDARVVASSDNYVSSITVVAVDSDSVPVIEADVERILRDEHRLAADEDNDFTIQNQQSLLDTATAITDIFTVLLGAIASISLVVGGIGIMNIMLVSVTERTKEIGLRKAIGARRSHILQQFLIETIVLSTLGGVIGIIVGVGIAVAVNSSGLFTAAITWDAIALGIGFSMFVGVFFGVYPANEAAKLEPIEALRYE